MCHVKKTVAMLLLLKSLFKCLGQEEKKNCFEFNMQIVLSLDLFLFYCPKVGEHLSKSLILSTCSSLWEFKGMRHVLNAFLNNVAFQS